MFVSKAFSQDQLMSSRTVSVSSHKLDLGLPIRLTRTRVVNVDGLVVVLQPEPLDDGEHGDKIFHPANNKGETPKNLAIVNGHLDVAQIF